MIVWVLEGSDIVTLSAPDDILTNSVEKNRFIISQSIGSDSIGIEFKTLVLCIRNDYQSPVILMPNHIVFIVYGMFLVGYDR